MDILLILLWSAVVGAHISPDRWWMFFAGASVIWLAVRMGGRVVGVGVAAAMCLGLHDYCTGDLRALWNDGSAAIHVGVLTTFSPIGDGRFVRAWLPAGFVTVDYIAPLDQGAYSKELGLIPACAKDDAEATRTYQLRKYLESRISDSEDWWVILPGDTAPPQTPWMLWSLRIRSGPSSKIIWLDWDYHTFMVRGSAMREIAERLRYNQVLCSRGVPDPLRASTLISFYEPNPVV